MIGRTDLGWATAYWHRMTTAFSIGAESTCIKDGIVTFSKDVHWLPLELTCAYRQELGVMRK